MGFKKIQHPPDPDTRPIFIVTLRFHTAFSLAQTGTGLFPEEGLGGRVAVLNSTFGTFFVIDYEGDGDFGAIGPGGVGWLAAVANEVTGEVEFGIFEGIEVGGVELGD